MCDVTPRVCVTSPRRWWSKEGASVTRTIGSSLLAVARDTSAWVAAFSCCRCFLWAFRHSSGLTICKRSIRWSHCLADLETTIVCVLGWERFGCYTNVETKFGWSWVVWLANVRSCDDWGAYISSAVTFTAQIPLAEASLKIQWWSLSIVRVFAWKGSAWTMFLTEPGNIIEYAEDSFSPSSLLLLF